MKRTTLTFMLLLFLGINVKADEPPSWEPYKLSSKNGSFFSWITFKDSDTIKNPSEREWIVTVFTKDSITFWKQPIKHSGYPGGILTDDGKYLVFVEDWYYSDLPIVKVYRKGLKPILVNGNDFKISEVFLLQTVSHKLWLGEDSYHIENEQIPKLVINTIDTKTWFIELQSGKLGYVGFSKINLFILLVSILVIVVLFFSFRKGIVKLLPPIE